MLWTHAHGVAVVTASGNPERIPTFGKVATLPDVLTEKEIEEIATVGKTIHYVCSKLSSGISIRITN